MLQGGAPPLEEDTRINRADRLMYAIHRVIENGSSCRASPCSAGGRKATVKLDGQGDPQRAERPSLLARRSLGTSAINCIKWRHIESKYLTPSAHRPSICNQNGHSAALKACQEPVSYGRRSPPGLRAGHSSDGQSYQPSAVSNVFAHVAGRGEHFRAPPRCFGWPAEVLPGSLVGCGRPFETARGMVSS